MLMECEVHLRKSCGGAQMGAKERERVCERNFKVSQLK